MTDPYATLGEQLLAAASQQRARRGTFRARSPWRARRVHVAAVAAVLLLAGSAIGVAATGLLDGSPVSPEVAPNPDAGNGVPVAGERDAGLALLASDPTGGLPWGLRVLHTTRGQMCVQVGRVQGGQLGELGVDSAFGDDGRFHPLSGDVLPPGYGGSAGQIECTSPGQTVIFEDAKADRSGVRLLPAEFAKPPPRKLPRAGSPLPIEGLPPAKDLRALAYGLLGPHAVSVTYRTPDGLHTVPVRAPDGAFLLVEPTGDYGYPSGIGGSIGGEAGPHGVAVTLAGLLKAAAPPSVTGRLKPTVPPIVSAVTFRFGSHLCSQGVGAPVREPCPTPRPQPVHRSWFSPTRSLREPVGLRLLPQAHEACAAAFLLYPCYEGQVSFIAPYRIGAAGTDYDVEAVVKCKVDGHNVGGQPETAWGLERDVRAHEPIRTVSLGKFVYTPKCASTESFRVTYRNPRGPSRADPHESVIVGSVSMKDAALPGGAPGGH
jgi:hypothetical protein